MKIYSRLAMVEKAARAQRGPLPERHFVTVDGGLSFVENTPAGVFDFQRAVMGCGGDLPAEAPRFTPADLAGLERDGCLVLVVRYFDMREPMP